MRAIFHSIRQIPMTILFSKSADYFWLSNFSPHGFELDGKHWPTVEHYFQAAKFLDTDGAWAEQIRQAATPAKAKSMGRSREHPIRRDWEQVKDDVMRTAVRRKFETHADCWSSCWRPATRSWWRTRRTTTTGDAGEAAAGRTCWGGF